MLLGEAEGKGLGECARRNREEEGGLLPVGAAAELAAGLFQS